MNPVSPATSFGTAAELIVQLRLWQFGVQAAPPLKDSGNDLIAIRGETFKAIQIKATASDRIQIQTDDLQTSDERPKRFHVLALVFAPAVPADGSLWTLDDVAIFLVARPTGPVTYRRDTIPGDRQLGLPVIEEFWPIA